MATNVHREPLTVVSDLKHLCSSRTNQECLARLVKIDGSHLRSPRCRDSAQTAEVNCSKLLHYPFTIILLISAPDDQLAIAASRDDFGLLLDAHDLPDCSAVCLVGPLESRPLPLKYLACFVACETHRPTALVVKGISATKMLLYLLFGSAPELPEDTLLGGDVLTSDREELSCSWTHSHELRLGLPGGRQHLVRASPYSAE